MDIGQVTEQDRESERGRDDNPFLVAIDEAVVKALAVAGAMPDQRLADGLFNTLMNQLMDDAAFAIGELIMKSDDPDDTRDDFVEALDDVIEMLAED